MAAAHPPLVVGHADVEVTTIGREAARQGEDFQVAFEDSELLLAGQPEWGHRQAADATEHPAGLLLLLLEHPLQAQPQIGAGCQTDRYHSHGLGRLLTPPWQPLEE